MRDPRPVSRDVLKEELVPYTVNVVLFDVAGTFSTALPTMRGSIFSPPPPSGSAATPIDTATNAPGTMSLPFMSSAVPPAGSSALLVRQTATTPIGPGDLFRSGVLGAYPTPPTGTLTLYTPPGGAVGLSAGALATAAAGLAPAVFPVPGGVQFLAGLLTGGMSIPLALTVAAVTLTTGAGTITLTITGTMTARQGIFFLIISGFTLTVTLTAAPSADPTDPSRVVAITPTASTLVAGGIPGFVTSTVAPAIGGFIASMLESRVNGMIMAAAPGALAGSGMMLTPTAKISALRITITASGISLLPVLGDFFGPGLVPIPGNLNVSISPTPVVGVQHSYVVTVTNSVSGAPVAGATVKLVNYTATTPQTAVTTTKTTNALGVTPPFTVSLHFKKQRIVHGANDSETELFPPTLTVSASGFNTVVIDLL